MVAFYFGNRRTKIKPWCALRNIRHCDVSDVKKEEGVLRAEVKHTHCLNKDLTTHLISSHSIALPEETEVY